MTPRRLPQNIWPQRTDFSEPRSSRADTYRRRAIQLRARQARGDKGERRFLLDKARNLVNVADALAPLPPEEPEIFLQQSKQKNG